MRKKRGDSRWVPDGMTEGAFEQLSPAEQVAAVVEHRLSRLSPEELKRKADELEKGTERFVREMRLKRVARKGK